MNNDPSLTKPWGHSTNEEVLSDIQRLLRMIKEERHTEIWESLPFQIRLDGNLSGVSLTGPVIIGTTSKPEPGYAYATETKMELNTMSMKRRSFLIGLLTSTALARVVKAETMLRIRPEPFVGPGVVTKIDYKKIEGRISFLDTEWTKSSGDFLEWKMPNEKVIKTIRKGVYSERPA